MPRSRIIAAVALAIAAIVGGIVLLTNRDNSPSHVATVPGTSAPKSSAPAGSTAPPPSASTTTTVAHDPARDFTLTRVTTVSGAISPKSVIATGTGLVFAQNMM